MLQLLDGSYAEAKIITFHGLEDGREHVALSFGDALEQAVPIVRLHSECLTGDVFSSARCDCGPQLREAISLASVKGGLVLYLRQEGRGIGLYNKLDAYHLQNLGMDTYAANRALDFADDQRTYVVAAQMLLALGVTEIEILTNNPDKVAQLQYYGISIVRQRFTVVYATDYNWEYLQSKAEHSGHAIVID